MKQQLSPTSFIALVAAALSKEGRLTIKEDDSRDNFVIEITAINREFGSIVGKGGRHVSSMQKLVQVADDGIRVKMNPGVDLFDGQPLARPQNTEDLINGYMEMCRNAFGGFVVTNGNEGYHIIAENEIDPEVKSAMEHIFFSVGRSIGDKSAITWG